MLDFIGTARQEFRFDIAFRALFGGTRKELEAQIEAGLPFLPSGCSTQLDRVASSIVLQNLKSSIKNARAFLRQELRSCGPAATLSEFLERLGGELGELYFGGKPGWIQLRRQVAPINPHERLSRRGAHWGRPEADMIDEVVHPRLRYWPAGVAMCYP